MIDILLWYQNDMNNDWCYLLDWNYDVLFSSLGYPAYFGSRWQIKTDADWKHSGETTLTSGFVLTEGMLSLIQIKSATSFSSWGDQKPSLEKLPMVNYSV